MDDTLGQYTIGSPITINMAKTPDSVGSPTQRKWHKTVKSNYSLSAGYLLDEKGNNNAYMSRDRQNQQNGCAPSEDSDQPGHPPSLIRVFAVHMKKAWVLGYTLSAQRRLWSDWADAQADLSLRWVHTHFVGFVMSWLIYTVNLYSKQYIFLRKIFFLKSICKSQQNLILSLQPMTKLDSWEIVYRVWFGPDHAKMCLKPYANSKGADQPARPCSLISPFVVCLLNSTICIL